MRKRIESETLKENRAGTTSSIGKNNLRGARSSVEKREEYNNLQKIKKRGVEEETYPDS